MKNLSYSNINIISNKPIFELINNHVLLFNEPITSCSCARIYGVAVDVGTTTIVASLVNLSDNKVFASESIINPQTTYGGDILTRISFIDADDNHLEILQQAIISALDHLIKSMCNAHGIGTDNVYGILCAGNSTMIHILYGINPTTIAHAPYTLIFSERKIMNAVEIGFSSCNSEAKLITLPLGSPFIGSDVLAGINLIELEQEKKAKLFIDIGTNGEIALVTERKISACSCAMGPALEGMNISMGMMAVNGAIDSADLINKQFSITTISNSAPKGICGSGLLDIIRSCLDNNIILSDGRINSSNTEYKHLFFKYNNVDAIIIAKDPIRIILTQKDIREVQLAKGALLSGILTLLKTHNIAAVEIDKVIIAGQFGNYLSEDSLITCGFIPEDCQNKINYIGNSALDGAIYSLCNSDFFTRMSTLSDCIDFIELSTLNYYNKLFINSLNFKNMP
jgi:uncharacterized 2Fe-2S/4Fe-4S cluster protein (DUF4445 family)